MCSQYFDACKRYGHGVPVHLPVGRCKIVGINDHDSSKVILSFVNVNEVF